MSVRAPAVAHARPCRHSTRGGRAAFSLVEILVAMAVLTILLLVVSGLVNSTASLTALSTRKISADSQARMALDRISADLKRLILRSDLPQTIGKSTGNDSLTFYSQMDGYTGDRGVSRISYGIVDGKMQRGAKGTSWDGKGDDTVAFDVPTLPSVTAADSGIMGSDIFRFEVAFLMRDGTIQPFPPESDPKDAPAISALLGNDPTKSVAAIIVSVAVLDTRLRKLIPEGTDLANYFPDAQNNRDIGSLWNEVLRSPQFLNSQIPEPVRSGIRIYQRYYFLER